MCFADISTGEVRLALVDGGKNLEPELVDLLSRYSPAEVIFNPEFLSLKTVLDFIKEKLGCSVTLRESECFDPDLKKETVYKQFSVSSMDMLGLAESGADVCAVCGLFEYIGDTQKTLTGRFTSIRTLRRLWLWILLQDEILSLLKP